MVIVLVVLTVAAFMLADWYLIRRRQNAAESAAVAAAAGLFLHPGHTWVRIGADGRVLVGASDFAASFAGALATIELPQLGARLRQGQPAWTLVSAGKRRLTQVMPVEGEVVEVNPALRGSPAPARQEGSRTDWILRVRPRHVRENLLNLLHGEAADLWVEATRSCVNARLRPALGRLANDGGQWLPGFGDLLEDSVWQALRRELFPADGGPMRGA